jgi:hypothetical protein
MPSVDEATTTDRRAAALLETVTAPIDANAIGDVGNGVDHDDEESVPRTVEPGTHSEKIEMPAELQDIKISKASNGANYDITIEVGIEFVGVLASYPDGFDATFKKIEIGAGGEIKRISIPRDADGNRHCKLFLHFAKSEVRKSAGRLATLIGDDQNKGTLVLEPAQLAFDLTTRAE